MTCTRDCFNCPYPDCIMDDETPAEIGAAERRDREAMRQGKPKRKHTEKDRERAKQYRAEHRDELNANRRACYIAHKAEIKAKKADYYRRNKETILAQQRAYKAAHADEISNRNRERYRRRKEEHDRRSMDTCPA